MTWKELEKKLKTILKDNGFEKLGVSYYQLKNPCKGKPSPQIYWNEWPDCYFIEYYTISYSLMPNGTESFKGTNYTERVSIDNCEGFSGIEKFKKWIEFQKTIIEKAALLHKKNIIKEKEKRIAKDF